MEQPNPEKISEPLEVVQKNKTRTILASIFIGVGVLFAIVCFALVLNVIAQSDTKGSHHHYQKHHHMRQQ